MRGRFPSLAIAAADTQSPSMTESVTDLSLAARDGYALAATLYRPSALRGPAVLINPATGVPRRFYDAFARYLTGQGLGVLSYDYRGTGQSLHGPIRAFRGRFTDWGEKDMPAALDLLAQSFPETALAVVGHSAGGQILGLADNAHRIAAAWHVAAQSGYWRLWPQRERRRLMVNWYLFQPLATRLLGFYPGDWVGSARLPAGIADQWRRFCRNPHYISDERGEPLRPFNHLLDIPMHFTGFADDPIARPGCIQALFAYYPKARIEYRAIAPAEIGQQQIGHFGYFRKNFPVAEWQHAIDWLRQATAATPRPPVPSA